jgi:hypothetical protein
VKSASPAGTEGGTGIGIAMDEEKFLFDIQRLNNE